MEIVETWIHIIAIIVIPVVTVVTTYVTNYSSIFQNPQIFYYIIGLMLFVNIGFRVRALFRDNRITTFDLKIKGELK